MRKRLPYHVLTREDSPSNLGTPKSVHTALGNQMQYSTKKSKVKLSFISES